MFNTRIHINCILIPAGIGILYTGYNIVKLYVENINGDISTLKNQIHYLSIKILEMKMSTNTRIIRDNSTITDMETEEEEKENPIDLTINTVVENSISDLTPNIKEVEEHHEIQDYEYIEKKETSPKIRKKGNSISEIWTGITENIIYY
jgi:hypothetical protein